MRIIFLGSPSFAVPTMECLAGSPYRPLAVVTKPDSPQGRGLHTMPTAVKERGEALGLPVLTPASLDDSAFLETLRDWRPDLFVVVAFAILPPSLLRIPRLGCWNIHPSLLPAYRGAAPVERAILDGAERTGVSLMWLEERLDRGPLVEQEETPIGFLETAGELRQRLGQLGASLLLSSLQALQQGESPQVQQDDSKACWAPKIRETDTWMRWEESALRCHNRVRAMNPVPGASTIRPGKSVPRRLKIWRGHPEMDTRLEPGEVRIQGGQLLVGCGEGALAVESLQQEGKKPLEVPAFLRGVSIKEGERWG
jgi:methionyl-tRNA formyltransferase